MPQLDAQIVRITTHPSAVDGESMKFGEIEGVVETWFSQHGCTAAIVRPDRYVFAVASDRHQLMQQLHELDEALK